MLGYPRNLATDTDQESIATTVLLVWLGTLSGPEANSGVVCVMLVTSPRLLNEVPLCRTSAGDSPRGVRTAR